METKIEELKKDIGELESLEKQATRQKIKDIISIEIRKLVSEIVKLEEQSRNQPSVSTTSCGTASVCSVNKNYQVKVNNYAWDQSNKFVKFYITLQNVHDIPSENIKCKFTSKSVELQVIDLDNKDYVWRIKNLLKIIDPESSSWKIKTDMVIISVAKKDSETWSHVTELEKKSSDAQKLAKEPGKMDDPMEGIMSLMKNMYEKGDDEMKRTIAKAWTESQRKGPAF